MNKKILMVLTACLMVFTVVVAEAQVMLPQRPLREEIARLGNGPADGDFSFVVMGDTRDGHAMFAYMIELANMMNPKFIINVGDLVHSGATDEQYVKYHRAISKSRVPFFSVIGNHESAAPGGLDRYKTVFGEPDFYFDFGGARFIALDNAAETRYTLTDKQFEWLEKLLKTDKIKFIFMHAPPKTHMWSASMDQGSSTRFMNMVEKYGVRKVYFGHVHAYDRLRRGETDYVMTGCAGAEPDPVSEFYHKLSGGYYHFLVVQVRKGRVIDVLVEPETAGLYNFPNADGIAVETPYVAYRHFNTPVIRAFDVDTSVGAGTPLPVMVEAAHHPESLESGLRRVEVVCETQDGRKVGPVSLKAEPFDERFWRGELPAIKARPLNCSVKAQDSVLSTTMNLFPVNDRYRDKDGSVSMRKLEFTRIDTDRDEAQEILENELDIRALSMAYDEKYFYVKMDLDAPPEKGDRQQRIYNMVGLGLMDENIDVVPDVSAMLKAVPLVVYAPLATAMGMPKCAIYDVSGFRDGQLKPDKKGVDCKVAGQSLYFQISREATGLTGSKGVKVLAATGQFIMQPAMDFRIGDSANFVLVKLGEFGGDRNVPWPYAD
ncbi:MAG TPA: metallophosphoesterase [bacterium]|nr:metallophosphoesterase [bacterium]